MRHSILPMALAVAALAPSSRLDAQLPPPASDAPEGSRALPAAPRPALPIAASLPAAGAAPAGFAPSLVGTLDVVLADAIAAGATPGAALVVGHGGEIVLARSWGRVDWDPESAGVDEHTVYDLASLTKVAGTTVAAMLLAGEGRLSLDRPVAWYLPGWPTEGGLTSSDTTLAYPWCGRGIRAQRLSAQAAARQRAGEDRAESLRAVQVDHRAQAPGAGGRQGPTVDDFAQRRGRVAAD
ncbi:MAG: beta-lactamase family protein, partial [Gemmatimonadetes bacterium]|nr:beta-lactamase family protein [Gemmatimonadota bacterium]